VGQRPKRPEG